LIRVFARFTDRPAFASAPAAAMADQPTDGEADEEENAYVDELMHSAAPQVEGTVAEAANLQSGSVAQAQAEIRISVGAARCLPSELDAFIFIVIFIIGNLAIWRTDCCRRKYGLAVQDFAGLAFTTAANPRNPHWHPMRLYLLSDVNSLTKDVLLSILDALSAQILAIV
jgi:hypothetical protein